VVLLPETDETSALDLAERIRAAVRAEAIPHLHMPPSNRVTVSIGLVCVYPSRGESVEEGMRVLLECADAALYEAKNTGRDRVAVYDCDVQDYNGSTLSPDVSDAPGV